MYIFLTYLDHLNNYQKAIYSCEFYITNGKEIKSLRVTIFRNSFADFIMNILHFDKHSNVHI